MLRASRGLVATAARAGAGAGAGAGAAPLSVRSMSAKIVYTETDEAPYLATYSLLPIFKRFTDPAGIVVEKSDISVAGRILAHFPDYLKPDQQVPDNLTELGELCKTPDAYVIKLPNVSASIPQLQGAIAELQSQGYAVPDFPANPTTDEEKDVAARYAKVLGSAVNPVLREGNSDRHAAAPVKAYAQKHPSKLIQPWKDGCRSHVAHMEDGDFFSSEQSTTRTAASAVRIEHVAADGTVTVMREEVPLLEGEIIDSSRMSVKALKEFYAKEIKDAKDSGIMLSLHLKATMMKVSDPILFGHCVTEFYGPALEKHADTLAELRCNVNNGIGDVYEKIQSLPDAKRAEIEADLAAVFNDRPGLAMVDSRRGITNLHVPSDVIIDASMPNVVRDAGGMWNKDDGLEDVKCLIPDRSYARMYKEILDDCRAHGQFDPTTMGHTSNVGLMAQKAEEYGSHDKTFEVPAPGTMRVVDAASGDVVFSHDVDTGDVWRMCQTKDDPIKDWVGLAVRRARATGAQAQFWLDAARAHDAELIKKVETYLKDHDTSGLDLVIMAPHDAMKETCARARAGKDTITVTGNVLRDYLTDLWPILELGTSAKMLSIVPMLAGGCMWETGAGGSAPKHVQQFVQEGHLRWDSLGEYLAMACALEELGEKTNNDRATLLGRTLMDATGRVLDENKSPSRKVNEPDNRATNFWLARYWAEIVAGEDEAFKTLADKLTANESQIAQELIDCQGAELDIGGYYHPDPVKTDAAMNPSPTFNAILKE